MVYIEWYSQIKQVIHKNDKLGETLWNSKAHFITIQFFLLFRLLNAVLKETWELLERNICMLRLEIDVGWTKRDWLRGNSFAHISLLKNNCSPLQDRLWYFRSVNKTVDLALNSLEAPKLLDLWSLKVYTRVTTLLVRN